MPTPEEFLHFANAVVKELDHYQRGAPFVACVEVEPDCGYSHVFVSRSESQPSKPPSSPTIAYVGYRSPIGRIAELAPGEVKTAVVHLITGAASETSYHILAKDVFKVRWEDGGANAFGNEFSFLDGRLRVENLRTWITRTREEIAADLAKPVRRRVAERLELADIPVVDSQQGEVWRTNIRRFMVIAGAPGTGKTTTAIKRLAQKTDASALREEVDIPEERLSEWLGGPKSWALFTPSELLRNYLHQALADEKLPATEARIPLWKDTRTRIGRDALKLFGQERFFRLASDQDLIVACDSESLANWTTGFLDHFSQRIHAELRRATTEQTSLLEETVMRLADRLESVHDQMAPLQAVRLALDDELRQAANEHAREEVSRKLNRVELDLAPLAELAGAIEAVRQIWGEVAMLSNVAEGTSLGLTLRGVLSLRSNFDQFRQRLANLRLAESDLRQINQLLDAGQRLLGLFSGDSEDSLDAVLRKLAVVYHEYRLRASEGARIYRGSALVEINNRRIAPVELDSVIYVALQVLREAFGAELPQRRGTSMTHRLAGEFRYVVVVDEATDFSVVELACMRMLAHPVFDCVTFAGDPMQRLTGNGIRDWKDLRFLVEGPEIYELRHSYRQSKRLLGIASKLFEESVGRPAPFDAGFRDGADDPEALRYKAPSPSEEAEWLVQRVGEIYRVCGERLPSIALITPEERDVTALAELLKAPLLESFGIETEDCPQGRIFGTQAKVRVFSVQFIKGLEFEAVFFVGIDRIAASAPELVDRFLYVGLTRARSFLAVTHTDEFPAELGHVVNRFTDGDWKRLIPQGA